MTQVTVVDSNIVSGVTDTVPCPHTLDPGESVRCETKVGTAISGQFGNLATVTGTAPGGSIVSHEDPSHYFGVLPIEACCFPDGGCDEMHPRDCRAKGGEPGGPNSDCDSAQCPKPQACCLPTDECVYLDPAFCRQREGTPQGSETECSPNLCEQQETVACCLPDGLCDDILEDRCLESSGIVIGEEGQTCFDTHNLCQQFQACYLPGECINLPSSVCIERKGDPASGLCQEPS